MEDEHKYIAFRGTTVELTRNTDGFWCDDKGTIYAVSEPGDSVDDRVACGVGVFSLPDSDVALNDACAGHDFAYSSPVYQAFHTRAEADLYLENQLKQVTSKYSVIPGLFYGLARWFGGFFWDNKNTNN